MTAAHIGAVRKEMPTSAVDNYYKGIRTVAHFFEKYGDAAATPAS